MLIRGTTPTHVFFKIPVTSDKISSFRVSYFQNGEKILTKDMTSTVFIDDPEEDTCIAEVHLTQEDTLLFKPGPASVQGRMLLINEEALATDEIPILVKRVIEDGIIR